MNGARHDTDGLPPAMNTDRTANLADRLAPVEEQRRAKLGSDSATGSFKISHTLYEDNARRTLRPEPVVLFILALLLCFIAFIAYLVSKTPAANAG